MDFAARCFGPNKSSSLQQISLQRSWLYAIKKKLLSFFEDNLSLSKIFNLYLIVIKNIAVKHEIETKSLKLLGGNHSLCKKIHLYFIVVRECFFYA